MGSTSRPTRFVRVVIIASAAVLCSSEIAAQLAPSPLAACDTSAIFGIVVSSNGSFRNERRIKKPCSIRNGIDSTTLGGTSARTLSASLAGRLPSLTVQQSSGVLGAGSRVRFRGGYGLIIPREPLLIVDGVRADASQTSLGLDVGGQAPSRLDDIAVDDIDRIDVLPGPAAAAEYGAAAAGGVILVSTKRGVASDTRWRSYVESGLTTDAGNYPDNVATGAPSFGDSACTRADAARGQCVFGPVSRWNPLEEASPFRTGMRVAGGVSATGRSKLIGYYVSGDGSRDEGPLAPNDQHRYSVRGNVDFKPIQTLQLGLRGSQLVSTTTLPFNSVGIGVLRSGLTGNTADDPVRRGYYQNDPATLETIVTQQHIARAMGSAAVTWTPNYRIKVGGIAGREVLRRDDSRTFPLAAAFGDPTRVGPWDFAGSTGRDIRITLASNATIWYPVTRAIKGTTTLGVERLTASLRTRDSIQSFFEDGTPSGSSRRLAHAQSTRTGFYANQQLGAKDRRLEFAIRRDGRDERYLLAPATSWSARAAWELASARFLPDRSWMRGISLHAGYGVAADSRPVMAILESLAPATPIGVPSSLPEYRSEHVAELEVGASLRGFVKDLNVDLTAFRQGSSDAYERGCCIGSAGFDDRGEWHTIGAELAFRTWLVRGFHTEWQVQLTASLMHNEYDGPSDGRSRRVDGIAYSSPASRRLVPGYPIGGAWGRPLVGRDANGDGVIVPAEITPSADSVYLGAAVPSRQVALATTFNHRRLTLSVLVDYRGGYTVLNETESYRCGSRICNALYDPGASVADETRAVADFDSGPGFLERADFARLREVGATYALAPSWAWRMGIERFDLTLSARNLWTITGYSGIDPEVNVAGQTTFGSVDHFTQPIPRTFLLRVALQR